MQFDRAQQFLNEIDFDIREVHSTISLLDFNTLPQLFVQFTSFQTRRQTTYLDYGFTHIHSLKTQKYQT
jgi:hypothetical protein